MAFFVYFNIFESLKNFISNDNSNFIIQNSFETWISKMFNEICQRVPLLLLYFLENQIYKFQLCRNYFAFCNDYNDFVYNKCPGGPISERRDRLYSVICVIKSIKNRLLWTFYTSGIEVKNKESITHACVDIYMNYINNVHGFLIEYYNRQQVRSCVVIF